MVMNPITIVGGGLSGLALGIGLRQRNIPVTVWETGHYPRHRVCGEFLSGQGLEVVARFGLRELFNAAGSITAQTAAFNSASLEGVPRRLPSPALCLSRFAMDALLAQEFRRLGGDLKTGARYADNEPTPGLVRASGRRVKSTEKGWRWFGLKAHAHDVTLLADLEMHVWRDGYVGLCRLPEGAVNVCGLFRRHAESAPGRLVWGVVRRGPADSALSRRLANARFDETTFCSVAGLSLQPIRATNRLDCCIGDAITMIPPVTGNGMSMAFESAALAIEPLSAYSRAEMTWSIAQRAVASACDTSFTQRLRWAKWLQWTLFHPALQTRLGAFVLRSEWLWQMLFSRTR
jgi:2-polyprenyl-6-methoxyphenol hydroxylase-like FAD-dependent oxidoreductase